MDIFNIVPYVSDNGLIVRYDYKTGKYGLLTFLTYA